jgi:hypothetical protein
MMTPSTHLELADLHTTMMWADYSLMPLELHGAWYVLQSVIITVE